MGKVSDSARFLREFVCHPVGTGAIAPSSAYLAREMVTWLELDTAQAVVEYGPGTGVFTGVLLNSLPPTCRFFAVEYSAKLAALLRTRFPDLHLCEDTVANVRVLCDREGISEVDCIVCGLPWAAFSNDTQQDFLDAMMTVLRPGGQFVTFAYLQGLLLPAGQRFRKRLGTYFSEVSTSRVVWLNLPPAFVYRCRR